MSEATHICHRCGKTITYGAHAHGCSGVDENGPNDQQRLYTDARGAGMTLTIRQHWEHVQLLTQRANYDFLFGDLLKEINEHAVAALKALDEVEWETIPGPTRGSSGRIVRDLLPTDRRLVPDPAPPTENTQPIRSDPAATTTTKRGTTA